MKPIRLQEMSHLNLSSIDTTKQTHNSQKNFGKLKLVFLHCQFIWKIKWECLKIKTFYPCLKEKLAIASYMQNHFLNGKTEQMTKWCYQTKYTLLHYDTKEQDRTLTFQNICFVSFNKSPLKMMKNVLCFILRIQ